LCDVTNALVCPGRKFIGTTELYADIKILLYRSFRPAQLSIPKFLQPVEKGGKAQFYQPLHKKKATETGSVTWGGGWGK
jgi:hypothetical protein